MSEIKVRQLEWEWTLVPPCGEWLARSAVGLYCARLRGGALELRFRDAEMIGTYPKTEIGLSAAKAAAQADYEARILAALASPPVPAPAPADGEAKPVAWRWRFVDDKPSSPWSFTAKIENVMGLDILSEPLYATPPAARSEPAAEMGADDLVKRAVVAVLKLDDWTNHNETEFTGWGDGEVPPGAEFWRVKSGQALKALRDLASHKGVEVDHG